MRNLREFLENLSLLCWNATEKQDKLEEKVQEYLKTNPHLRTPAGIDLLRRTIKTWQRIERLEQILDETTDPSEEKQLIYRINSLTKTWLSMLGNCGISYTRQQYKSSKKVVQPPIERLKMLTEKGKNKNET